jgi:transposase-like protein
MAKLGQQVDVYCGRCKVERYHTVAAISADGRIERVQCDYCQSTRAYKDPLSTTKKATGAPRTRRTAASQMPDESSPARTYSPDIHFDKGEVISHTKYGRGRVIEVRGNRVDVRFSDGNDRTFVHRNS